MVARFLLLALLSCFLSGVVDAKVLGLRKWTDQKDRSMNASLVRVYKVKKDSKPVVMATFKLQTGKKVDLKVQQLSKNNQKELMVWLKDNPSGVAPPSPPYFWPRQYNGSNTPKVEYVKFDKKREAHLYRTKHFDFYMDIKLSKATVSKCVAVFDTIVEAIDMLPMQMDAIPSGDRPRYEALLVGSRETYMKMGGIPNSAGFFAPSKNLTVIPFESLGIVKKGNNWVFDGKRRTFETLLHELAHHSTSHWRGMPPWFEEGFADYMSVMPYQSGRFLFTNPQSAVVSSIRKYKDYMVGPEVYPKGVFQMRRAKDLMNLDRRRWNALMRNRGLSARNYSSSMVMACYFMHEDGSGDGADFIAWMHAWRAAYLANKYDQYEVLLKKHLLRGRSYAELEKDIQDAMRKRGLRIEFN